MYKDSTIKWIDGTLLRLKEANVSIYKISKIIEEPEPTLHNILKTKKTKYSEERVLTILKGIDDYLDGRDKIESDVDLGLSMNIPTYTKLLEVGLNSRVFTPEEKLYLAQMYKKLTDIKNQRDLNPNE